MYREVGFKPIIDECSSDSDEIWGFGGKFWNVTSVNVTNYFHDSESELS